MRRLLVGEWMISDQSCAVMILVMSDKQRHWLLILPWDCWPELDSEQTLCSLNKHSATHNSISHSPVTSHLRVRRSRYEHIDHFSASYNLCATAHILTKCSQSHSSIHYPDTNSGNVNFNTNANIYKSLQQYSNTVQLSTRTSYLTVLK